MGKYGVVDLDRETYIKNLPNPKTWCKNCEVYDERVEIANKINAIFDSSTTWSFHICYKACIKRKEKNYDPAKAHEKYIRRKERLANA